MAAHHACQPLPLFGDGRDAALLSWSLTSRSFARIRFEMVLRLQLNRPFLVFPQIA